MKKIVFLFFSLFLFQNGFGQNLVPNPSFEEPSSCPYAPSQILSAVPWFQPDSTVLGGSTDYYNVCDTSNIVSIPENFSGYQYARTGVGYAGFAGYAYLSGSSSSIGREYLEVQLINPLVSGKKYIASFYVSLSDKLEYAIDALGAYFSINIVKTGSTYKALTQYVPQVKNAKGNVISDTANWVLVSGSFIAQGGERYMTIGNFNPDSTTTLVYVGGVPGYNFAAYYIDDVSVEQDTSTAGVLETTLKNRFSIYPNPLTTASTLYLNTQLNNAELIVYDMLGKEMMRKRFSGNEMKIEKGEMKSGVYFVKVVSNEKQFVEKIIVE